MKPIDQTTFGFPDGNCYSACLASIFEVPLADTPQGLGRDPIGAIRRINDWLAPRGLSLVAHTYDARKAWLPPADPWVILQGRSPRGEFLHATVGRGGEVIHDPHPSRGGLVGHKREVHLFVTPEERRRLYGK